MWRVYIRDSVFRGWCHTFRVVHDVRRNNEWQLESTNQLLHTSCNIIMSLSKSRKMRKLNGMVL